MRKNILLLFVFLLGACSSLAEIDWNPFAEDNQPNKEESVSENVNPYLWKAAYDKLSFMGFVKTNHKQGWLETNWSAPLNGERLMIQVWINSAALRADSLQVLVLKQQNVDGVWQKKTASYALAQEIEKEILMTARELYRNNIVR